MTVGITCATASKSEDAGAMASTISKFVEGKKVLGVEYGRHHQRAQHAPRLPILQSRPHLRAKWRR